MAQTTTYRPGTKKMTAASTEASNGKSAQISTLTLAEWDRLIAFAKLVNPSGTPLADAGVRIYQLASTGISLLSSNLIATVFTDAQGEYGISLDTLTAPAVYAFEAFTAGN